MDLMAAGRVFANSPFIWVGNQPAAGAYDSNNDEIHIGTDWASNLPTLMEELAHRTYWDQGFTGSTEGEILTKAWVDDFISGCTGQPV